MIEPLRIAFRVACSVDHAFAIWAADTSRWWPRSHTVLGDSAVEIRFEPRIGGRIFERAPSGREVDWGEVTDWDPPIRLAFLWHITTERVNATDVAITFRAIDDVSTEVEIVHTGWERLGAAGQGRRDGSHSGWGAVIPSYVRACAVGESGT